MYYGERLNAWTHLIGAVLALIGAAMLLVLASLDGDPWKIVSVAVYGACLVLLYSISTLYHSLRGPAKKVMRKLDHLSIYLMIAGSYMPFCLVALRGPIGWALFAIVWILAALGMLLELRVRKGPRIASVVLYAMMGWIVIVAVKPLLDSLGPAGFTWLMAGGLAYTVGILFYAFDTRFRHWHGIWHLFVVGGSLLHFIAVWRYVI